MPLGKFQDNRDGLELNELHQLLLYANDMNMLGKNSQTIRENTEILLEASKAIGLEVNPEKIKYMIMSRDHNIVRNGNTKLGDLSFEEVENFKYLGARHPALRLSSSVCALVFHPDGPGSISSQTVMEIEEWLLAPGLIRLLVRETGAGSISSLRKDDPPVSVGFANAIQFTFGLRQYKNKVPNRDNVGEMSPGSSTESYPAFARIGLRENPGKNLNQVTCPERDSNPGHLVSQPDALTVTPQGDDELRGDNYKKETRRDASKAPRRYAQNSKSTDYTDDAALHNTHWVRTGLRNYIAAPPVS
ncbi:hypothetical protein ANN_02774 [Periplaneta americana]|uniref:Reverse transcriptase domain-containing protein n=1 Tax=Periplaneta americana TaxID=6978 RepID=A0ABQ8TYD2_PERAM|nr:hypothetical protein ANN_02774 [Periplaneta americana]